MALFAAVCTMMLVALLVAGGIASVNLAQSAARTNQSGAVLASSARAVLVDALSHWTSAGGASGSLDSMAIGATARFTWSDPAAGTSARVTVTALPHGIYWLVADVTSPADAGVSVSLNLIAATPAGSDAAGAPLAPRAVPSRAWATLFQGT